MALTLTTPQIVTNGTRTRADNIRPDEDERLISFTFSLRTAPGGTPADSEIAAVRAAIRGPVGSAVFAMSDVVSRGTVPSGGRLTGLLAVAFQALATTDAQFVSALTAARTSRAAFEAHLLSAGYVNATLAAT